MKTKTNLKAGDASLSSNHNQTVIGLSVKTALKARSWNNHNQTIAGGLRIKSAIKAGALSSNHNGTLAAGIALTDQRERRCGPRD